MSRATLPTQEIQDILARQIEVNFMLIEAIAKVAAGEFTKEDGATIITVITEQMDATATFIQEWDDGAS